MTDKTKKIVKWSGLGAMVLGMVSFWIGGGTEGMAMEIVGGVFGIISMVITMLGVAK